MTMPTVAFRRKCVAAAREAVLELLGFRRVTLAPGESRTVVFDLHAEQFPYTAADYRRIVEPGQITLAAGTSSTDLPETVTIGLTGPIHHLRDRHHYLTGSAVE